MTRFWTEIKENLVGQVLKEQKEENPLWSEDATEQD